MPLLSPSEIEVIVERRRWLQQAIYAPRTYNVDATSAYKEWLILGDKLPITNGEPSGQ